LSVRLTAHPGKAVTKTPDSYGEDQGPEKVAAPVKKKLPIIGIF
jgi:hypothetical protein